MSLNARPDRPPNRTDSPREGSNAIPNSCLPGGENAGETFFQLAFERRASCDNRQESPATCQLHEGTLTSPNRRLRRLLPDPDATNEMFVETMEKTSEEETKHRTNNDPGRFTGRGLNSSNSGCLIRFSQVSGLKGRCLLGAIGWTSESATQVYRAPFI